MSKRSAPSSGPDGSRHSRRGSGPWCRPPRPRSGRSVIGVVFPRARLEVGVLVVARGWRSMTTRSTTQRVAAGLLAGSGALGDQREHHPLATSTSSRRPPDRCADAQPLPQPTLRPWASQPTEATISRPHRPGRRPRPAPGSLPGDRRHQPDQRRAVDLVGLRSCGSPWRPSSRSAVCYLVEYAGSAPAQDSQLP